MNRRSVVGDTYGDFIIDYFCYLFTIYTILEFAEMYQPPSASTAP
jgi:hypothetical protein